MLRLFPTFSRTILLRKQITLKHSHLRFFLSDSFKLENPWNERLQSPILKKINVNDLFVELDHQFQHYTSASALDIDLFVNAVDDDSCFDEIEDVVHKLRLSPEAVNILPSTHHAIIRLYVKCNKVEELMRVLDDRLNYGIFCDDYCSLLLMDTFIKEGNFRDAAKVSTLSMLQENASNPLINYMSLYACHKYLENPVPWNPENKEEVQEVDDDDDDDEEVVKVRVKFIRNPFFDDHFDLVDPNHLVGKTLTFIGSEIDDHIGRTYKLLGLLLHDKLELAKDFILSLSTAKQNNLIVKGGLNMAHKILDEKNTSEDKSNSSQVFVTEIKELLNSNFPDSRLVVEGSLISMLENKLKDLVNKNEISEINKQLQAYKEWEQKREKLLLEQIAEINRQKLLVEVEREKQRLKEKEEEIFFFDNEDKLDLIIEEKERIKEEERERERQRIAFKSRNTKKEEKRKSGYPPIESFFDENIPMKIVKDKL